MPTLRQRAVSRTPSGNPVWRELEDLPLRYRAMPADDQARATERAALREAIYRQMAGTMVRHVLGQAMAAEMAASAGGEASDAGFVAQVDRLFDTASAAQAQAQAPVRDKVQLLRSDSPLELIFRAEAKRLAGQHGDGLARAYGGATNLAADAQQGLVVDRSLNRRTTLLSQWQPERGSLYTFISRKAASFLTDLARQEFGRKGADGMATTNRKPKMLSIDQPGRTASAVNQHGLLDAAAIEQMDDADELREQRERARALTVAIAQLPDELRIVAQVVLLQHDEDRLSDQDAAVKAKLPRSTYMRRKQAVVEQLRLMLAGGG